MRASGTVLLAAAQMPGNVVPARTQMAATLGFHIILACLGIALPSVVLLAGIATFGASPQAAGPAAAIPGAPTVTRKLSRPRTRRNFRINPGARAGAPDRLPP